MRVVGGNNKGRRLVSFKGRSIRPTSDKVRQAIFNILGAPGAGVFTFRRVLDVFAGSGALGIEALSRGAVEAVFVDSDPASVEVIRKNLALCGVGNATVMAKDFGAAIKALATRGAAFDLVFLDPPYAAGILYETLVKLGQAGIVEADGAVVAETSVRASIADEELNGLGQYFNLVDERRYGDTLIYIFSKVG